MNNGRTLKIFLVDGTPSGLLTAEIMNWTGHVLTGPRSKLSEMIQRPEVMRTGVYFLVGPDVGDGIGTQVYIGETDDAAQRLKEHNRPEDKGGKDFWERVCVVTSKDANLTKGHIKYLESRLIKIARAAGRCDLRNGTDHFYANLPEADRSDMEYFVEQIQTLLPVLGFAFLRAMPRVATSARQDGVTPTLPSPVSPIFVGDIKKHGITARAQEVDGEFVVMKGSKTRLNWEGVETSYTRLFKDLLKAGVLSPSDDGHHNIFAKDYAFTAPSAAAAVVAGRNANGRIHWTVQGTSKTYGEWQDEQVTQAVAQVSAAATPAADATAPEGT
jgi:Domain of unknown function (DUF4357)